MAFSLAVGRAGWKLLYDPLVGVDHYLTERDEPRHYVGVSAAGDQAGLFDFGYNEIIALWRRRSPQKQFAVTSRLGRILATTWRTGRIAHQRTNVAV